MSWDPNQYLKFEGERLRPAVDLLARIALAAPRVIVDLGCGAGNVARLLGERWPGARIVGVDGSAAMLAKARAATEGDPRFTFIEADLATWTPEAPVDLVYSNAALHWLPDHEAVFARVVAMVAAGGMLAVQMPDNFRAPSHTTIAEHARSPRWQAKLGALVRDDPVAPAAQYFRWLAPQVSTLDIWATEYLQVLPGNADDEHPVATWTKGTWLSPFLAALDGAEQREFLAHYNERLKAAYPPLPDGRVLFAFRRLFIVANR
jgi:trans-aconitate 2-methyltransferase